MSRAIALGRRTARKIIGYPFILNANAVNESAYSKRALQVYLTKPFQTRFDDPLFYGHQNLRQSLNIAEVLNDLGYIVDVAHYLDEKFIPPKRYDFVISHRVSLGRLSGGLKKGTRTVYLASGMNHIRHNAIIREAYTQLRTRRGCELRLPPANPEDMDFVKQADAIVGFGNKYTVGTWGDVYDGKIYPFNNYALAATPPNILPKDFERARRAFIFFASATQVGKGLDMLLEIFPSFPELQLFVCSPFKNEPDFCACYKKELFQTPNVHPVGWISIASSLFAELMKSCAFVIHPTRTEGQPGSVVQCMYEGLIPLVSQESGIDTEDFGLTFEENTQECVRGIISTVSNYEPERLRTMSQHARRMCESKYSEANFVSRWRSMLTEITEGGRRDDH